MPVCRPIYQGVHRWGPMRLLEPCPNAVAYDVVYPDFGEGETRYPLCAQHAEEIRRRWQLRVEP